MATITDIGIETMARMLTNTSPGAAFTYLATGTGTTAESASDTALVSENASYGAQRAAATCSFTAPGTSTWTKLFSFTGNVTIREIGIFSASSAGNMFMRHLLTANKTYSDGESVEITITNSVSRV